MAENELRPPRGTACRDAFEKWAEPLGYGLDFVWGDPDGCYESGATNRVFDAWIAAWNTRAGDERVREIIEIYAGMDGFKPKTAAEGYLLKIIDGMVKAATRKV